MAEAESKRDEIIVLFDVDGTLTPARKVASPEVLAYLAALKQKVTIGMVGGSDLVKQKEQLGPNGEEKLKKFINFVLKYLADVDCPEERDAFEEYDKVHNIRKKMVAALEEEFADFGLKF
ncbi:PMM, partial [Symbiodinium sp. KB8]